MRILGVNLDLRLRFQVSLDSWKILFNFCMTRFRLVFGKWFSLAIYKFWIVFEIKHFSGFWSNGLQNCIIRIAWQDEVFEALVKWWTVFDAVVVSTQLCKLFLTIEIWIFESKAIIGLTNIINTSENGRYFPRPIHLIWLEPVSFETSFNSGACACCRCRQEKACCSAAVSSVRCLCPSLLTPAASTLRGIPVVIGSGSIPDIVDLSTVTAVVSPFGSRRPTWTNVGL